MGLSWVCRRPGGRRKKIPKILLQQQHQQPDDDEDFSPVFPPFFPTFFPKQLTAWVFNEFVAGREAGGK